MNNYREESSCTLTEQTSRVPLHMVGGPDVPFSGSTRDPLALASVCLSACLSCRASGKFALWLRNMQPLSTICNACATKVAPQDGARNRLPACVCMRKMARPLSSRCGWCAHSLRSAVRSHARTYQQRSGGGGGTASDASADDAAAAEVSPESWSSDHWPDGTPKKFIGRDKWKNWIEWDSKFTEQTDACHGLVEPNAHGLAFKLTETDVRRGRSSTAPDTTSTSLTRGGGASAGSFPSSTGRTVAGPKMP